MKSNEELERMIGDLRREMLALPTPSRALNTLSQLKDVQLGTLTNLDALVYIEADNRWENEPGGGSASFPISFSNGTYTFTISVDDFNVNNMDIVITKNSDSSIITHLQTGTRGNTFDDNTNLGTLIRVNGDGGLELHGVGTGGTWIRDTGGGGFVLESDAAITVRVSGSDLILSDGTGLGFFGAAPVGQQPAPSTLGDVIAGLEALGLFT